MNAKDKIDDNTIVKICFFLFKCAPCKRHKVYKSFSHQIPVTTSEV